MEAIRNNKGGIKLCFGGFMYNKKGQSTKRTPWECLFRGSIIIDLTVTVTKSINYDNHWWLLNITQCTKLLNTPSQIF